MNYSSLGKFYDDVFSLQCKHGIAISDLMDMIPFERDTIVILINKDAQQTAESQRLAENLQRDINNARRR